MPPYTTSSKSKTFPKGSDYTNLMAFVTGNIETQEREIQAGGAEPFLDLKFGTTHKYIITITKIEEKAP